MINLESEFSPRVNPADANYPFGSIKDNTSPGANDGTPLAAVWGNNWEGFAQAAMTEAGITPSGLPDTAQNSQLLDAVKAVTSKGGGFSFRNKIINGKMDVQQRGVNFIDVKLSTYLADRFAVNRGTTTAVVNANIVTDSPSPEFLNSLKLSVTTADATIGSTDFFALEQRVEGYNARDLVGKTFTLSFWVKSPKTGKHCISFRNRASDRSYVLEYTVNAANTWEKKTVTVVGGLITDGGWDWTNDAGLLVSFVLMCGATYQVTAGSWVSSASLGTVNQVNCLDTVSSAFLVTGIQLEVGEIETPFEHRPYSVELALCQRYYEIGNGYGVSNGASGVTPQRYLITFKVTKRADPFSYTITNVAGTAGGDTAIGVEKDIMVVGFTSTAIGQETFSTWAASAEL